MFDLLLAICAHRVVSAPTSACMEKFRLSNPKMKYTWGFFIGDALIARCRSQACSMFLNEMDMPYMIFVDDDIAFEPEHINKIYEHLSSGKYDVIGGIYPVRGACQISSYGYGGKLDIDGQVHEIEYLATGFMGISRRILKKIQTDLTLPWLNPNDWSKCYPFFEAGRQLLRDKGGDPIYISEDWDFCEKVRKVGGKCYADTSVQLGHQRDKIYTVDDIRQLQTQSFIYNSMNKQKECIKNVVEDLSEFLKWKPEQVVSEFGVAQKKLAQEWNTKTGTEDEFYKDNLTYLFDLATFNANDAYFNDRASQLINIRDCKVIDIGCGLGTASFMMAGQGNDVIGYDINQKCIDFANFKKNKYKFDRVNFTTQEPDYSQAELIIAIDVLEHIDNLHDFLVNLGSKVKKGCKFYHSDFFPKGEVWPMHHEENQAHLSEWLKESGLVEWDNRWAVHS